MKDGDNGVAGDNSVVALIKAARQLVVAVDSLTFKPPVTHVYNPLVYAWAAHEIYLRRFGAGRKKVVFVGMNPGPFGMVQTGVPFGEITAVRDWMGIVAPVSRPPHVNPRRPVEGFDCHRSEVSGQRLWGLFAQRFGAATAFFADHFVLNYCPLAFFAGGRNFTPDKLPADEQTPLFAACDAHLRAAVTALAPQWVIGVGVWAEKRLQAALGGAGRPPDCSIGRILHPSPASPTANRGWALAATGELQALGVW